MAHGVGTRVSVLLIMLVGCVSALAKEPPVPFTLTATEQTRVDDVLQRWEQWNAGIRTFRCDFKRWTYNVVFTGSDRPQLIEAGHVNYAAPNRCLFSVDGEEKDGKMAPIDSSRAECWASDGAAFYGYIRALNRVEEYPLPPALAAGKLIDGPLSFGFPLAAISILLSRFDASTPAIPFPFGAKAEQLKTQYYIRVVTPADRQDQIWLEAYPRRGEVAATASRTTLIVAAKDMSPVGLELLQPNGKDFARYRFDGIHINERIYADWFGSVPPRWEEIVKKTLMPDEESLRGASDGRR